MELKNNIHIEGFDTDYGLDGKLDWFTHNPNYNSNDILYSGFTSEISESLASKICDWMFWDEIPERKRYYNYGKRIGVSFPYLTAKESIQSACNKEYCIIYKLNKMEETDFDSMEINYFDRLFEENI